MALNVENLGVRAGRAVVSVALAGALVSALASALAVAPLPRFSAFAEDIDTNPTADALQLRVEETAAAYDEALAQAADAAEKAAENASRIAELQREIPLQQARSDAAACKLYKFQQQSLGIIDLLLGADDFFDFLTTLDYINRITATNVAEVERLNELKTELESAQSSLENAKSEAESNAIAAERALTAAQEARMEAQRQAQEEARQIAEANAAAVAAASDGDSQSTAENTSSTSSIGAVVEDGADWSSDEATFVESWAGRIDAYLDGSPLAGQGRNFAQAAWNYGVDPRWSPAIAYVESSLGAYCFRPHNAWGWGSVSWGSWEEAIDAHVRGLARGYGYTISMDAAYKYCPSNAEYWYNTTLAQMNQI